MRSKYPYSTGRYRTVIIIVCSIFVGLTLLVAGTGKLPGQAEFAEALMGSFFSAEIAFIISRVLPWLEIALGMCLILGVFPRMAALISLFVVAGFITNNAWALTQGIGKFAKCGDCFGFWENIFGTLSPGGALIIDILLFCAALIVVLLYPEFFKFKPWFTRSKSRGTEK